ncbi:MAG: MIP family channel protein [Muribaculaceae bacterium]|nr:MIP family channel protein [Muribaculaceae bacterium]
MKKYLAELVGTFVLTLLGCGAAVSLGCNTAEIAGTPAVVGTALAFGLAVVAMAYTIGGISGCHINPAITLGCLLTKRISFKDSIFYMIFQVIGAIAAGALLCYMYGCESGIGANNLQTLKEIGTAGQVTPTLGLVVEIVLTALFVLVVLGATAKANLGTGNFAGLAIGLSLVLIHLVGIHFTGTSVNPARSIGPAIFAGDKFLNNLWIFIVGPFAGGILAAIIWKIIEPCNCKKEEE